MTTTFPQLLLQHAAERPDAAALREKEFGIWQTWTWAQLATPGASRWPAGLHLAGLRRGENLVVIGANRPHLYITMLAAQAWAAFRCRCTRTPWPREMVFLLDDAEVDFVRRRRPGAGRQAARDPRAVPGASRTSSTTTRAACATTASRAWPRYDALIEAGRAFDAAAPAAAATRGRAAARAGDVAVILYTSGTTGNPKGVCRRTRASSPRQRRRRVRQARPRRRHPGATCRWPGSGEHLLLRAVAGRRLHAQLPRVGRDRDERHERDRPELLLRAAAHLRRPADQRVDPHGGRRPRPSAGCIAQLHGAGAARGCRRSWTASRSALLDRCMYALGNLLVYGPLRNVLGMSRIRVAYTAGAAIGPDLFRFYRSIGVNLKQFYGQTETCAYSSACSTTARSSCRPWAVPHRGIELKSPTTARCWCAACRCSRSTTSDPTPRPRCSTPTATSTPAMPACSMREGHLRIIDRAKDVGRLKGGANDGAMFAPNYIENKLKFFPQIKEAVCFGDGRDEVCAFINIDFDAVGNWAERRGLPYGGYVDLARQARGAGADRRLHRARSTPTWPRDARHGRHAGRALPGAAQGARPRRRRAHAHAQGAPRLHRRQVRGAGRCAVRRHAREQYIETQVKFEDGRTGGVSATLQISDAKTYPSMRSAA